MVEVTQEDHGCAADVEEAIWNESEDIAVIIARHRTTALAAKEAELAEMTRRRDEWRKKAEGFDAIRHALREKVGSPWPPSLSRALWAALAADEKKRADDAEAELAAERAKVEKLREALLHIDALCPSNAAGCTHAALSGLLYNIEMNARATLAETQP